MYYEDENNLYHYNYRKGDTNPNEPVDIRNYAESTVEATDITFSCRGVRRSSATKKRLRLSRMYLAYGSATELIQNATYARVKLTSSP